MVVSGQLRASTSPVVLSSCARELDLAQIRRDGETQGRVNLDFEVVHEYAALLRVGAEFPPVRTWFDGTVYWLTDGFHRIAAAEATGNTRILAEVFEGTLAEAQWDSYASNSNHGLRRSRVDMEAILTKALQHPTGLKSSTNQLAKHLGVPEPTVRRWRKRLSSSNDEDSRFAVRGGITYAIEIKKIGRRSPNILRRTIQSKTSLKESLAEMKRSASPQAHRMLNIMGNWIFSGATASECLLAIENLIGRAEESRAPSPQSSSKLNHFESMGRR
jgi:hypothetical protein